MRGWVMETEKTLIKKNEHKPALQMNQTGLLNDIRILISEAKRSVVSKINATQTMLYWHIGERINRDVLQNERAEYGKQIVSTLSRDLSMEFGKGFSEKSLRRMLQFAEVFPEKKIVASLMRQLSWTHFTLLIPIKDKLQVEFYAQMCRLEGWSVRILRKKIDSMLFERTAISKKPDELIRQELSLLSEKDKVTPSLVMKDPYLLDFLDLKNVYSEKDVEQSILNELELFILELGSGFTFVERQKRMIIDEEDHYLDLLFFHRRLKRLIAIELKIGKFKAAHKGQLELYLRWLERYETLEGENPPLGIILCAEGKKESIELLELNKSGIHVAEYLTELPPRELLEQKLHIAMEQAKARINFLSKTSNEEDEDDFTS